MKQMTIKINFDNYTNIFWALGRIMEQLAGGFVNNQDASDCLRKNETGYFEIKIKKI